MGRNTMTSDEMHASVRARLFREHGGPGGELEEQARRAEAMELFCLQQHRIQHRGAFAPWRTITLGGIGGFLSALEAFEGFSPSCNYHAVERLRRMEYSSAQTEVSLVKLSPADLGLGAKTSLGNFFARALATGLLPCSPEVGPELRLQYLEQPDKERIGIASKPMHVLDGKQPELFVVQATKYGSVCRTLSTMPYYAPAPCGDYRSWVFMEGK